MNFLGQFFYQVQTFLKIMAAVQQWFLHKDDFNPVLAIIESDLLEKDGKFDSEINTLV